MGIFLQLAPELTGAGAGGVLAGIMAMIIGFLVVFLILFIALYIYFALVLMKIAKKTQTEPAWLAWIPFANLYLMSKIAGMHWWPILLIIPSFLVTLNQYVAWVAQLANLVFAVFVVIWWWKILKRVGRPGWWILLVFIPFIGFIIFLVLAGVAAWGNAPVVSSQPMAGAGQNMTRPGQQNPKQMQGPAKV